MAGILSYGSYVPRMRLGPHATGWPYKHERPIANYDEDPITMAVAATSAALAGRDRGRVDALYLASTSLPYIEKQSASLVATATDLGREIVTADIAHSLRSGTLALRMALDGVRAGSFREAVVVASDARLGISGSDIEREGGDAAAALVIGDGPGVIAEVVATHSVVNEILDTWRSDGERIVRASDEDRFRYGDGYLAATTRCVEQLCTKTGRKLESFDRVVLYAPDGRRHAEAVKRLGLSAAQTAVLPQGLGSNGAAHALVQLAHALDQASPGQSILVAGYGDGADAIVLETTAALAEFHRTHTRTVARLLETGVQIASYYDYLQWRGIGILTKNGQPREAPAPHAVFRDQGENLRFYGMRCTACGKVQWPAQRVCVKCRAKDENEPVRIADGGGTLFTYSMDYNSHMGDAPLLLGVVDFEVGGRAMMFVTDRDLSTVQIGMPLELTFRKLGTAEGIHTYIWKAAPVRVPVPAAV